MFFEAKKNQTTINTHAKDIEQFITNSKRYGGYYIGRYEARTNGEDEGMTENRN